MGTRPWFRGGAATLSVLFLSQACASSTPRQVPSPQAKTMRASLSEGGLTVGANPYVAKNRLLARYYRERDAWYRAMLVRLPELNRELNDRVRGLL